MAWWNKFLRRRTKFSIAGQQYKVVFSLYSKDGKRAVEILEFKDGQTFLREQDWVDRTTFKNRHGDNIVGPFASPDDAEKFIVATAWFRGEQ